MGENVKALPPISHIEAEKIANEIDFQAGDFFKQCMVRAAIKGAELAKQKTMPVIDEIAAERKRQIEVEGWSAEHDDDHGRGELSLIAAAYAAPGAWQSVWPPTVDVVWFKPKDRRRDLIRAGALIVAEIERLDRIEPAHD